LLSTFSHHHLLLYSNALDALCGPIVLL
jgi:hypothetical protein